MAQNNKKNFINVYTASTAGGLKVSAADTRQVISATNNHAQYFAELAEKYKDEAKHHRDNAKYYAEQNSDVTFEYIDNVKNSLLTEMNTKQPNGDYALRKELPTNISELQNDIGYSTKQELLDSVPSQENCEGRFLFTNGEKTSWNGINSFSLFDTKFCDRVLEGNEALGWALQGTYVYKEAIAGSRYGYPDFYNKCLEERNTATATEVALGNSTITMYIASNGHQYYDITNKDTIDAFFGTMGTAWFYGIDTENERIFLPRNNFFEQATGDISEVGKSIEAGLPDHIHNLTKGITTQGSGNWSFATSGTHGNLNNAPTNKASVSNSIYGKSDTVQPNAVKKLLYICVGNTTNYEGMTEVVNQGIVILEQVNQGIESRVKLDGSNAEFPHIVETYQNGTSWYRICSDGWCEQGGMLSGSTPTITLMKSYKDTNYMIFCQWVGGKSNNFYASDQFINTITVNGFKTNGPSAPNVKQRNWMTCGYIN